MDCFDTSVVARSTTTMRRQAEVASKDSRDAAAKEELDRCQRILGKMPERLGQVIRWAQIDRLSHAEIAARLGISEANSRKILSRAMAELVRRMVR